MTQVSTRLRPRVACSLRDEEEVKDAGRRNRGMTVELNIYTLTQAERTNKLVVQTHAQKLNRL
jgi:hypothetical protein